MLLDAKGPYLPGRYWRLGPYSIKDLDLSTQPVTEFTIRDVVQEFECSVKFPLAREQEASEWRTLALFSCESS